MRKNEMRVGQQYEMQRGPTRRPVLVTLLAKDAPSEMGNRVVVRIEEGVGKGNEREAPTVSIFPLPGNEPMRPAKKRSKPKPVRETPPGWMPSRGETVTWEQTGEVILTVLQVDVPKGKATVEGKLMGVLESYEAAIAELSPYKRRVEVVDEDEVDRRLGDHLPEKVGGKGEPLPPKAPRIESAESEEDIVERLVFAEQCLNFYGRRFAKGATAKQAEQRLRAELRNAEMIRKRHTREYLRLRVPERFDVVLYRRPIQGDFQSCLVTGLQLPASRRRKAA